MKYDFINELGYLAIAARFKRLSENMVHSARMLYKNLDVDLEPNWFLILKLLKKYGLLSVTEIAAKIHFSHPSVIDMVNKMEKRGYLVSTIDSLDSRKRLFQLSHKSIEIFPQLEMIWEAGERSIEKLLPNDSNFLSDLESMEIALSQKNYMDRTLEELKEYENNIT